MAATKSKRSIENKQLALSIQHSAKARSKTNKAQSAHNHQFRPRRRRLRPHQNKTKGLRRLFHFPQAKDKLVEDVEFSTFSDYHNISINFQDKTSLNFSIETGFTLEGDYSDWKTGNQRILRAWQPIRVLNS